MDPMKLFSQQKADSIKNMPEAQSLFQLLSQQNDVLMEQILHAVQSGDYVKVKQLLQPTMESKQVQDTLQQIGRKLG